MQLQYFSPHYDKCTHILTEFSIFYISMVIFELFLQHSGQVVYHRAPKLPETLSVSHVFKKSC